MPTENDNALDSSLRFGKYRCKVEAVDNPDGLILARVRILGEWDGVPVKLLPWAEYLLPVGARANDGDFKPAQVGDIVWCSFDRGDSRYPIIEGSAYFTPAGVPNLPHEVFGGDEVYQHKRTASQPAAEAATHHIDRVSTQYEFMFERLHTGGIRATHKPTGTAFEITKDGQLIIHVEEDSFESTSKSKLLEALTNITITGGQQIFIESKQANVKVNAATECTVDAPKIHLNGGSPIVTTAHICAYTGKPHLDGSSTCTAGK